MPKVFKLICVMQGSGWPSGHVAIDSFLQYEGKPGGSEMCLNHDACTAEELVSEIDKLIGELEELKLEAAERFNQWNVLHEKLR